jgi:hypothetical protein
MIADFILRLDGVEEFKPPSWDRDPAAHYLGDYYQRRAARGGGRVLLRAAAGAKCGPIGPTRDQIILDMRRAADGNFQKDAFLCLFGSSNGAAVALALAAELQNDITIVYLCLSDLPLFNGGRSPEIPGVGNCAVNRPAYYDVVESGLDSRGVRKQIVTDTIFGKGDRPKTTLNCAIEARIKDNIYQHSGNSIEPFLLRDGWKWTSTMPNHEVHGEITNGGWNNFERDVSNETTVWWHAKDGQYHRILNDNEKWTFDARAQKELGKA